ncbi:hypothetical protein GWI33_018703 [Rhynchophorus ferrugineus]|uniref:Uncharacterized protein n=1 Tax=Rhynchophorus ferrugineus TaxID=354439 RepID=A0A834M601_RHYFE|nr:hypothetical protein GWI33_018703 [Rhynchophorus ferrugineus]
MRLNARRMKTILRNQISLVSSPTGRQDVPASPSPTDNGLTNDRQPGKFAFIRDKAAPRSPQKKNSGKP